MEKRNVLTLGIFILASLFLIFLSSPVSAVCCEKTVQGAWCQDDVASNCAPGYQSTPSVCERTAYCKTGTCIDPSEGRCIANTPQTLCQEQGGTWDERAVEEIAQCQVGCCFFENGDTSPLTLNRCKAIAGMKGLEISEYRTDIADQIQCLAMATSPEKGACVIDNEVERNCKQTTRQECNALETSGVTTEFTEGYLCSADFLGTICGKSKKTTCVEDMVYFVDTCGNIANVYDASKADDQSYWNKIIPPEDSCGYESSNSLSETCGNCNYGLGSYCESYESGKYPNNPKPQYGDYICSDLSCRDGEFADAFKEENRRFPLHGESWCLTSNNEFFDYSEINQFSPGEESYVMRCSNGEVTYESASTGEWRQKICREYIDEETGIHFANLIQNSWLSCLTQNTQEGCEDLQERDCVWMEGYSLYRDEENNPLSLDLNENYVEATCVPKYSPAFNFWGAEDATSSETCSIGSTTCVVTYELGSMTNAKDFGDWSQETKISACTSNCYCLKEYKKGMKTKDDSQTDYQFDSYEDWLNTMNNICWSLGDCGTEVNYIGEPGRYDSDDEIIDTEYFRKRKEFEDWANKQ